MKKEKELEKCQKERKEYLAGWQRAKADFLNYKKEEKERIEEIFKYTNEDLILKMLPIFDNFELFEKNNQVAEGFLEIKRQLQDFLKKQGVEEIKGVGERFDPNLHEAVEEVESKNKKSGTIVKEIKKGYKLAGKVIRPAKVKIVK